MLEKAGYRENYELLRELFPGRATVTTVEAAEAMGADVRTIRAAIELVRDPLPSCKIGEKKVVIPIPALARWMCGK
mgnify:CR=1 FL=1